MTSTAAPTWRAVGGVSTALTSARSRRGGGLYPWLRYLGAAVFVALLAALVVTIAVQSSQGFAHSGIGFIWSGTWNPAANQYGAGILIVGTLLTTLVAMILVVPIGLGLATYLSEFAPRWLAAPIATAIDLLAASPTIVVGLWALLVLEPVFARDVEPFLRSIPLLGHLFGGYAYGSSILLASVVLAIMALPVVVTLSRTALAGVSVADREAAMAVGATRWQVIRTAVFPSARSGIAAAMTLAVGRALGESISVALVIGNRPAIPHSLLAPGATLGSAIVNQFAEASPGLGTSSIIALGAILLVLTLLVNLGGQALLGRKRFGGPSLGTGGIAPAPLPPGPPVAQPARSAQALDLTDGDSSLAAGEPPDAAPSPGASQYVASGLLRQAVRARSSGSLPARRASSLAARILCGAAVVVGVAPLAALIYFTLVKGSRALSLSFLTHAPTPPGIPGGGISTAITGSAKIAGVALLIAVPLGMLTALFLFEHTGRLAAGIRFSAGVLTGVPSIILGIFAYGLLVRPMHHDSTLAAGFALAILMLPILVRANEEAMRTVALDLWEAGIALGARRSRVTRTVVIRGSLPGLLSGNLLGLARAIGETAPLLFTVAAPTLAITLFIYDQATQAMGSAQQTAWGAAFVLLVVVLLLSAATRAVSWSFTRKTR